MKALFVVTHAAFLDFGSVSWLLMCPMPAGNILAWLNRLVNVNVIIKKQTSLTSSGELSPQPHLPGCWLEVASQILIWVSEVRSINLDLLIINIYRTWQAAQMHTACPSPVFGFWNALKSVLSIYPLPTSCWLGVVSVGLLSKKFIPHQQTRAR